MVKKKEAKPRPENYEQKLAINGTFGEVIKVALGKNKVVKAAREAAKK